MTVPFQWLAARLEGDVVATGLAEAVEGGAAPEGDRARSARPLAVTASRRCLPSPTAVELGELGADREQRHVRVPEPEGRQPLELLAEPEGQLAPAHDRVDVGDRLEIRRGEHAGGVLGERLGEGLDVRRARSRGRPRPGGRPSDRAGPSRRRARRAGRRRRRSAPSPPSPRRAPRRRSARPAGGSARRAARRRCR